MGTQMESCLRTLAEKIEKTGCKELAMTRDDRWDATRKAMRKMACLRGLEVTGYKGHKMKWSQVAAGKQSEKVTTPRKETLIVEAKEGSYSEVLKKIREDLTGANVDVTAIRKTRGGDILVEAKRTPGGAGKLSEALLCHRTRIAGGRTPAVIRGLDALVTKSEVTAAIQRAMGEEVPVEVADIWETYGDTRAVRVHTTREVAGKLANVGKLRVGPVTGRIKADERVRCFRCWESGHVAGSCKGPNRRDRCYRCGEEGHMAASCKGEERCLNCGEKGHRTMDVACKKATEERRAAGVKGRGAVEPNSERNFQDTAGMRCVK